MLGSELVRDPQFHDRSAESNGGNNHAARGAMRTTSEAPTEQLCGSKLGGGLYYGSTRNPNKKGLDDLPLKRRWLRGSDLN
jgi:hypothetical protein